MFEQAFRNIDDVLRKEAGCTTELDYIEQTSWLLFLKYLDGLEEDKATEAALNGKKYTYILDKAYRWESWAAPKGKDGKVDHNKALVGDDLRDFVNQKLFPYLTGFTQKATGPNTIEYKIGQIFAEIKNKISSGYSLRDIIDHIDELRFRSQMEKHELSHLYEAKIKNMGNAGRNGGEYYTPRPLIRAIIQIVQPKIGDKIYDGACGSAGFLCESFVYLKSKGKLTTKDLDILQTCTFYGKEKKSLAYVIAIMNMILHGIEAPNVIHTNTLTVNLADIQEKDRYNIVLANPPFGGSERPEVQQNFPIRTGETAFLFLQHFIKMLKAGGRGGIVIKNTFLSSTDNASASLRQLLLESCNLHSVLICPAMTFTGAGVKTVVLFFEKGGKTRKVWFYQLDPGRNLGKTSPLNDGDLVEFVKLQKTFADSPKSWSVDIANIDQTTFELSAKNPNSGGEVEHRSPDEIMNEIAALGAESAEVLLNTRDLFENHLQSASNHEGGRWKERKLGDLVEIQNGFAFKSNEYAENGYFLIRIGNVQDGEITLDNPKYVRLDDKKLERFILNEGDILVSLTGNIGRVGIIQLEHLPAVLNQRVARITLKNSESVDRDFLFRYLSSRTFRDMLQTAGHGAAQQNVSTKEIESVSICIPDIAEQRHIAKSFDFISVETSRLEVIYQQELAGISELKESLLQRVFNSQSKSVL